ncbi:hypothetical protein [Microvirga massiliensis]|uniref:hypothetical protein n=1 Tax=Microvirga massiliensis TaxID=1033741 RepID=UPI0007C6D039
MRAYNLFRRRGHADLVCAVPEDRPVPAFITAALWVYGGKLENADIDPLAFNYEAADVSVHFMGFYLFQATRALDAGLTARQGRIEGAECEGPAPRTAMHRAAKQTLGCWRPSSRANACPLDRVRIPAGLSSGL